MKKSNSKKGKKIGFGVLFVASCFAAVYILTGFYGDLMLVGGAAGLLIISAFLFLNALFEDKAQELSKLEEQAEEVPKEGQGEEVGTTAATYMKNMESIQKQMLAVLKEQNSILQTQIDNLENEIYMLSEKQITQTKTLIKYNKENARQLAISERETLEHMLLEIKKAIEDNAVAIPVVTANSQPVKESSIEELPESELFAVPELAADDEYQEPDIEALLAAMNEEQTNESSEEADIPGLEDIPEISSVLENVEAEEPEPIPEPMPEPEPVAPVASNPNAMMTPDEIAKLLESMGGGNAEEPEPEPEPMPEPEPVAPVASNPNAMMTPDEIAKLLESMGGGNAEEPEPEPEPMPEPEPVAPVASNPNAMMTPDEIAKLLESMGGGNAEEPEPEPEPMPEPEPVAPVASNPNAMMTPDEIAKLLESMGGESAEEPEPEPEPIPEPEPVAPVASNPNAMMTPDEIAKLLESMGK